jgi:hypothetical protein
MGVAQRNSSINGTPWKNKKERYLATQVMLFPYHIWQGVDGCQNFVNLKMECPLKCPCILRAIDVHPTSKRTISMGILISPWIN